MTDLTIKIVADRWSVTSAMDIVASLGIMHCNVINTQVFVCILLPLEDKTFMWVWMKVKAKINVIHNFLHSYIFLPEKLTVPVG